MGKYCCFFDPEKDYSEKKLDDKCPKCGRRYNYPLKFSPFKIIDDRYKKTYTVKSAIGRGFYSATYLCTVSDNLRTSENTLLKVSSVRVYEYFKKNFPDECRKHYQISNGTNHLVAIKSFFDSTVRFGEESLDCHVSELEYVDGITLKAFLEDESKVDAHNYAQIAIDLLKMQNELTSHKVFHNDLHGENIMVQFLSNKQRRTDAIQPNIKLVAIDLDSVGDDSFSGENRVGDHQYISRYVEIMANKLQESIKRNLEETNQDASKISDIDYRLILTLNLISDTFASKRQNIDVANVDFVNKIQEQCFQAASYAPWRQPLTLKQFDESINALTLPSWDVPRLLVDPDEAWLKRLQIPGPQLIIGMRGCGKTMLLSAMDIHARLEWTESRTESDQEKIDRIREDDFIALKESCNRIIDKDEHASLVLLFWYYAIGIVRAVCHVSDLDQDHNLVIHEYRSELVNVLNRVLGVSISDEKCTDDYALEKYLEAEGTELFQNGKYEFSVSPAKAFIMLADVFRNSSSIFVGKKVFFLLDDASTRFIKESEIREILSTLIFQDPNCAFKITTERQSFEFGIMSPGFNEVANEIRDYNIFDLGAEVYEKTSNVRQGKQFVLEILSKRKIHYSLHPTRIDPSQILGDCTLEEIARKIRDNKNSAEKMKSAYHGISALTALCVGDIGDVISIYSSILERYKLNHNLPVSDRDQGDSFAAASYARLRTLDTRKSLLRACAQSFAEANHKLLVDPSQKRIRQYTQMYVQITSETEGEKQRTKLRELLDAGVFVFADPGNSRIKAKGSDPFTQFKFTFRKLLGIRYYIGLASRDRFELSGASLQEWLNQPSKELLIKNHKLQDEVETDNYDIESDKFCLAETETPQQEQLPLFDGKNEIDKCNPVHQSYLREGGESPASLFSISPSSLSNMRISLKKNNQDLALITGLGFEDCSLESVKWLVEQFDFSVIITVNYPNYAGKSKEIIKTIKNASNTRHSHTVIRSVSCDNLFDLKQLIHANKNCNFVVDVTALNKPTIFTCTRILYLETKYYFITSTIVEYFPREKDILNLLKKYNAGDSLAVDSIIDRLYIGEKAPYSLMSLIDSCDELTSRPSALIGVLVSKNQRLLYLLEKREYRRIVLLCQDGDKPSSRLANMVGETIKASYENVFFEYLDLENPERFIDVLTRVYLGLYAHEGANVDIAITGSKMNAVVCAIFSLKYHLRQCWYVKPDKYDISHYSEEVANQTDIFEIITSK